MTLGDRPHAAVEYPGKASVASAVVAFICLPGVVAGIVPATWLWVSGTWAPLHQPNRLWLGSAGIAGLIACTFVFYRDGRGTLAPWSAPRRLVTTGPFRVSRNPMYVCVLAILACWASAFSSHALLLYGLLVAIAFHARIVRGEEPLLARSHPQEWIAYASRVPRWIVQLPSTQNGGVRASAVAACLVAGSATTLVWAGSPAFTGRLEPWDADAAFLPFALLLAGLASGGIVRSRPAWQYLGAVLGQVLYQLLFIGVGPLAVIGLVFVAAYSLVFLVGVVVAMSVMHVANKRRRT